MFISRLGKSTASEKKQGRHRRCAHMASAWVIQHSNSVEVNGKRFECTMGMHMGDPDKKQSHSNIAKERSHALRFHKYPCIRLVRVGADIGAALQQAGPWTYWRNAVGVHTWSKDALPVEHVSPIGSYHDVVVDSATIKYKYRRHVNWTGAIKRKRAHDVKGLVVGPISTFDIGAVLELEALTDIVGLESGFHGESSHALTTVLFAMNNTALAALKTGLRNHGLQYRELDNVQSYDTTLTVDHFEHAFSTLGHAYHEFKDPKLRRMLRPVRAARTLSLDLVGGDVYCWEALDAPEVLGSQAVGNKGLYTSNKASHELAIQLLDAATHLQPGHVVSNTILALFQQARLDGFHVRTLS
jgi:hypothetical protein